MVNALRTDKPLLGVGVAVPCPVVEGNLSEQILPAWKDIHLQSALEGMLGVRVFVGNDANLGALAERWWGSCQDVDDFVFVKKTGMLYYNDNGKKDGAGEDGGLVAILEGTKSINASNIELF